MTRKPSPASIVFKVLLAVFLILHFVAAARFVWVGIANGTFDEVTEFLLVCLLCSGFVTGTALFVLDELHRIQRTNEAMVDQIKILNGRIINRKKVSKQ